MIGRVLQSLYDAQSYWALPVEARAAHRADGAGLPVHEPGIERALEEAVGWLCRAQDRSASQDGGVARHFSLVTGWGASYPETTGYIVPTLLDWARLRIDDGVRARARRMLDWLVSVQLPGGAFQGGVIGATPTVPVVFNTGQILIGLARGVTEFGEAYREPMRRAADWLVQVQDTDGCWRKHASPFAKRGEKTYDVHVAWGLLEAARLEPRSPYAEAVMANVRWALSRQRENGWFEGCCLTDHAQPLTHTLGYALRGLVEAHRFSSDRALLGAARRTADGLLTAIQPNGFMPGRLDSLWRGTVRWACLTGTVQIAYCWLYLFQVTGEDRYREAALTANRFVRHTVRTEGPPEMRGGVRGSFPISGAYGRYEYLNWAGKFFVDALLFEREITAAGMTSSGADARC